MTRTRFPRRLYAQGTEPDARFSLANERTLLAWLSLGLALLSVGVALHSFANPLSDTARGLASGLLLAGGTLTPVLAWVSWWRTESALRRGTPLPAPVGLPMAVLVTTAVAAIVAVDLLWP